MDVIVSKADLSRALGVIQNIVDRKTTMPVLMNVLLTSSENELRIAASDLEINALIKIRAESKASGSTTLNAKIFGDIVRELPDAPVRLVRTDGERVEISSNTSTLKMIGVAAEEYPALPGISLKPTCRVKARLLSEMVSKTMYATSLDETRFNLNGVYLEAIKSKSDQFVKMTATDGHRLAFITRPIEGLELPQGVIIPRKGLVELRKVLDNEIERDVLIGVQEGFLIIESDASKMAVRLVDSEYPDCSQVLPKKKGVVARIPSAALCQALRRVALMVSDKGKCVRLDFSKDRLCISSQSPELGEAREVMDITYDGAALSVGFNAIYIVEACSAIGENQDVHFELHGELGPLQISAEGDDASISIVMPMRLA